MAESARSLTTDRNPTDDRVWCADEDRNASVGIGPCRFRARHRSFPGAQRPRRRLLVRCLVAGTGGSRGRGDGSAMAGRSGREVDRSPTLRRRPRRARWAQLGHGRREAAAGTWLGPAPHSTETRVRYRDRTSRLDYAFAVLGHNEVVSFTEVHNHASRAVMERLGMTFVKIIYERGLIEGRDGIHDGAPFVLYRLRREDAVLPRAADAR